MKKMIVLGAAVALVLSSCNASSSIKSDQDSLAYVVGMQLGESIKSVDSTMNLDIVCAGIKDAVAGKAKMDKEQATNFLREYFTVTKPAKEKEESTKFLAEVEKGNPNIKKTESGLLYEVIAEGTDKPAATDMVKVMYKGSLKDGKVFDSSYESGDTVEFALNRVIPGWSEGLQLVGKGGKIKLWIPSELGYGEMGGGPIGPNQALVFEVELIDVMPVDTTAVVK